MKNDDTIKNDRREFLIKTFSSCALCCLAAPSLFASDKKSSPISSNQKHKFESDSGMTMQQVYNFAFEGYYIPAMKNLMEQIGKDKFLKMLRKSTDMLYENDKDAVIDYNERTFFKWSDYIKKTIEDWSNRLTVEVLNDSANLLEVKVKECLWAKSFRNANASDIGYAGICYGDYAEAKQFNPKLKLIREKTLMQGHDCCHFKWIMEA
jgi:L-2-amino-thiazoline-4-carboxylic acid hydrolase